MGNGKYSKRCHKLSYKSEKQAWQHVVYYRRKGYEWMKPYLCGCGKYHLTSKWFDGQVPQWVKEQSLKPSKKQIRAEEKAKVKVLPLDEQKKLIKNLNKPWWYKVFHRWG